MGEEDWVGVGLGGQVFFRSFSFFLFFGTSIIWGIWKYIREKFLIKRNLHWHFYSSALTLK